MHLELCIVFHDMIASVTFKSPGSCDPSPKTLGGRTTSLWKWRKGGQGNENYLRRSLHLQQMCTCLFKSVATTSLAWLQCMHTCTFLHPDSLRNVWPIQFMIASCSCKTPAHLSSDTCVRSTARSLQTVETFPPQMWQMVWQHKLTWEHPFALSLALLHLALNVLRWADQDRNWQCRLLSPCCFPPPPTLD